MTMEIAMDEKELEEFLLAQIEEINCYKWIESEKQAQDIGFQQAALEWISHYSAEFKSRWVNGSNEKCDGHKDQI